MGVRRGRGRGQSKAEVTQVTREKKINQFKKHYYYLYVYIYNVWDLLICLVFLLGVWGTKDQASC